MIRCSVGDFVGIGREIFETASGAAMEVFDEVVGGIESPGRYIGVSVCYICP
jgi:hypothetical protein